MIYIIAWIATRKATKRELGPHELRMIFWYPMLCCAFWETPLMCRRRLTATSCSKGIKTVHKLLHASVAVNWAVNTTIIARKYKAEIKEAYHTSCDWIMPETIFSPVDAAAAQINIISILGCENIWKNHVQISNALSKGAMWCLIRKVRHLSSEQSF